MLVYIFSNSTPALTSVLQSGNDLRHPPSTPLFLNFQIIYIVKI
ncbi:hypothetical protein BGS_0864 [Beggiatoa sp. SS]|nr:hypothetical protein BGS_0864 [Beggiatoa sp. SS]